MCVFGTTECSCSWTGLVKLFIYKAILITLIYELSISDTSSNMYIYLTTVASFTLRTVVVCAICDEDNERCVYKSVCLTVDRSNR